MYNKLEAFDLGATSFNKQNDKNPYLKDTEEYHLWESGYLFESQGKIFDEMLNHIKWEYHFFNELYEFINNPNFNKKELEQKLKFGQLSASKFLPELFSKDQIEY